MKNKELLKSIDADPSAFRIAAIGDRKRFDANKLLLGETAKFAENPGEIKDCDVIVLCGEVANPQSDIPVVHISDLINYKSAKFWDNKGEYKGVDMNHHTSNPHIAKYMDRKRIKSFSEVAMELFKKQKKKLKLLSLGCGTGAEERELIKLGIFQEIQAVDISKDSIKTAKDKIEKLPGSEVVHYSVCDMNNEMPPLPAGGGYDIVIARACIHHVERLEFLFQNIKKALKKHGLFIMGEYTGAVRFQHCPAIINTVNALIAKLPSRLKRWEKYTPIRLQDIVSADPSEAVRSDEIVPMAKKYFRHVSVSDYPEIVLHLAYQCVNSDQFQNNKRQSVRFARRACRKERILRMLGRIKYYSSARIVARS